jgi:two-component system, LytTR family, response regulator
MNRIYSCIIADDHEIDRLSVAAAVKKHSFMQVTGMYSSAQETLASLTKTLPDIAFFDIDMPGISGLELRKQLVDIPVCVFITSYPDYAVDSFELAALDFIVKPLKAERFAKTAERIKTYLEIKYKANLLDVTLGADTIFVKEGHEQVKLSFHEVVYLEALKDYTMIVTGKKKYSVLSTLGNVLKEKPFDQFVRIHRSYAVQKHFIERIKAQEILVSNIVLPVGRNYKEIVSKLKPQL